MNSKMFLGLVIAGFMPMAHAQVTVRAQSDLAEKNSKRVHVRPSTWSRFPVKADPRLRGQTRPGTNKKLIAAISTTKPLASAASAATPGSPDARLEAPITSDTSELMTDETLSISTERPVTRRRMKTQAAKSEFTGMVSVGLDMRGERDQKQSTTPRSWPTLTIGAGLKPWMALFEYASFTENSGNNALNVERKVETVLVWGQWSTDEAWVVQPYMAVGIGGYRTSAEMTLYSQKTASQGKWIEHGAGALGLRLSRLSPFLLAVEGRVHMNRELDPSPTISGMLKMGFILE